MSTSSETVGPRRFGSWPFWARSLLTFGPLCLLAATVRVNPWPRSVIEATLLKAGLPVAEAAFLSLFAIAAVIGVGLLLALWAAVEIERPSAWRSYLLLQSTDWWGFLILLGIGTLVTGVEVLFLRRWVFQPIQDWLVSLGVWTEPGLATPPRAYRNLNLAILVLISWVEMAEEVYFRGYLQHELVKRLGPARGIIVSLGLWDLWHLWNPAMFVRRFFISLPSAIVVYRRGRVWSAMLSHPLGNRIGTVVALLSERPV